MKIVAISDVHGRWNKLTIPECDILISAGDYSFQGERHMVRDFHRWLNQQDAGYIISVQGNHEKWVEKNFQEAKELAEKECPGVFFMEEGPIEIEGLKLWTSAMTPWFYNWAYNRYRGGDIQKHWNLIPEDTDVLVTHGPPADILDIVYQVDCVTPRERVGCLALYNKVMSLPKLKHHIFGHIHGSYGHQEHNGKHFWNVAICDDLYHANNEPVLIEI